MLLVACGLLALFLSTGQAEESTASSESASVDPVATESAGPVESSTGGMEVVVTATANRGLEQGLLDVPQSVSVITREDLDNNVYNDVNTAIRREAAIGMAPEGGAPNYWNPGFSIRGLGGQRVLTLTNGIRQAGQGIGYGGGFLSLYDTFGIESIEILRGPRLACSPPM